jgi:hypothetical protein
MTSQWPVSAEEFLGQTRYRSVASVPLTDDGGAFGALDLYSMRTETLDEVMLGELAAQVVDHPIAAMILAQAPSNDSLSSSVWLDSDTPAARMRVWLAVGILVGRSTLNHSDALAVRSLPRLPGHLF